MVHVVSFLGFLTVAVATAGLIWYLLAERADAIIAALRMADPVPALPIASSRVRVRSVSVTAQAVPVAWRRAA